MDKGQEDRGILYCPTPLPSLRSNLSWRCAHPSSSPRYLETTSHLPDFNLEHLGL